VNGEAQRRLKELTRILSELAVPHPPLERFKLASRLWRLVAGLSKEEQKQLLREFGLKEAAHLEQLVEGRAGTMPATFLEFIERGAETLTPERIDRVLGALAVVAGRQVPPPPAPLDQPAQPDVEETDVSSTERAVSSTGFLEDEEDEQEASESGASIAGNEAVAETETPEHPSPGDKPASSRSLGEENAEPEEIAATAVDKINPDLPVSAPPGTLGEPGPASTSSGVPLLTERCGRLESSWKRRRFWLDIVRQGVDPQDAGALLRAVSESGLPSQDYVWVVDEMVVQGLLPEDLYPAAVELAPSERGARLLQRRLLTLSDSWTSKSRGRSQ
jgi:hypothetical protein